MLNPILCPDRAKTSIPKYWKIASHSNFCDTFSIQNVEYGTERWLDHVHMLLIPAISSGLVFKNVHEQGTVCLHIQTCVFKNQGLYENVDNCDHYWKGKHYSAPLCGCIYLHAHVGAEVSVCMFVQLLIFTLVKTILFHSLKKGKTVASKSTILFIILMTKAVPLGFPKPSSLWIYHV